MATENYSEVGKAKFDSNLVEKQLILALLHNQHKSLAEVSQIIHSEDIQDESCRSFYQALLELGAPSNGKDTFSMYEVFSAMEQQGLPYKIEDVTFFQEDPPTDHVLEIAKRVRLFSAHRSLLKQAEWISRSLKDTSSVNTLSLISETKEEMEKLSQKLTDDTNATYEKEREDYFAHILSSEKPDTDAIPTPYPTLNKYLNGGIKREELVTIGARTGVGKALDIKTPILTNKGWKTMKDIQVGDVVYGKDGQEATVVFATEIQYNRECFRVDFSNHTSIVADAEHLWEVSNNNSTSVYNTKFLFENQYTNKYAITKPAPLNFKKPACYKLPIDPYIFGYWLGKGLDSSLTFFVLDKYADKLKQELARANYNEYSTKAGYSLIEISVLNMQDRLKGLKVFRNKHLPNIYKYSSIEDRTELFKGFMDANGYTSITTPNLQIAYCRDSRVFKDMLNLANTLGLCPTSSLNTPTTEHFIDNLTSQNDCYYNNTNYFYFSSLNEYFKIKAVNKKIYLVSTSMLPHHSSPSPQQDEVESVFITNIIPVETRPVKCIQVDNKDHLYLAGRSLIPTHNTVVATQLTATACSQGASVLYFSLEMGKNEIFKRLIACHGNVLLNQIEAGAYRTNEVVDKIIRAEQDIRDWKLEIADSADITMEYISALAQQKAQSKSGLDVVIIDYLQLISTRGTRKTNRQEIVADLSRSCKMLARKLKCCVVVLVQLKRESGADDEDRLPSKADIKESGAVASDSDEVWILHRKNRDDSPDPKMLLILDKNRGGVADKMIQLRCILEKNILQDVKADNENRTEQSAQESLSAESTSSEWANEDDLLLDDGFETDDDYFDDVFGEE